MMHGEEEEVDASCDHLLHPRLQTLAHPLQSDSSLPMASMCQQESLQCGGVGGGPAWYGTPNAVHYGGCLGKLAGLSKLWI